VTTSDRDGAARDRGDGTSDAHETNVNLGHGLWRRRRQLEEDLFVHRQGGDGGGRLAFEYVVVLDVV